MPDRIDLNADEEAALARAEKKRDRRKAVADFFATLERATGGLIKPPSAEEIDALMQRNKKKGLSAELSFADIPHYRKATNPARSCGTCGAFKDGHCRMFNAKVNPEMTCDDWVKEYKGRRGAEFADGDEGHWVTIEGTHVFIGKGGKIEKGPHSLVGKKPSELGKRVERDEYERDGKLVPPEVKNVLNKITKHTAGFAVAHAPDLALFRQVLAVLPRERPAALPHRCGEAGGSVVWLVDGNAVKLRKRTGGKNDKGDDDFMDFVEGGNGMEDPELCGPNEIYIDALIDPICWPYIGYHECRERAAMEAGELYESAHDRIDEEEKILRERFPDPWAAEASP